MSKVYEYFNEIGYDPFEGPGGPDDPMSYELTYPNNEKKEEIVMILALIKERCFRSIDEDTSSEDPLEEIAHVLFEIASTEPKNVVPIGKKKT